VSQLAVDAAMGVAVGLAFSIIATAADLGGIATLISLTSAPEATNVEFVGDVAATFAIGATLTGLVFLVMDEIGGG
jgi:hypothetical protein